jgi:hypothetical protein
LGGGRRGKCVTMKTRSGSGRVGYATWQASFTRACAPGATETRWLVGSQLAVTVQGPGGTSIQK